MSIEVKPFINVRERLMQLGLHAPTGIAILPRNLESASDKADLLHESSTPTLRILWRQGSLKEDRIEGPDDMIPTIHEKQATFIAPMLFISAALLSENPAAVSLALNILGNYITQVFKGDFGSKRIKLSIVVEATSSSSYKKIEYDGDTNTLPDLIELVREVSNDRSREGKVEDPRNSK